MSEEGEIPPLEELLDLVNQDLEPEKKPAELIDFEDSDDSPEEKVINVFVSILDALKKRVIEESDLLMNFISILLSYTEIHYFMYEHRNQLPPITGNLLASTIVNADIRINAHIVSLSLEKKNDLLTSQDQDFRILRCGIVGADNPHNVDNLNRFRNVWILFLVYHRGNFNIISIRTKELSFILSKSGWVTFHPFPKPENEHTPS